MTPEDIRAWFDLQRETVERVHPSWLPEVETELVVTARNSVVGRRWLANRLGTTSPALFALPRGVGPGCAQDLQPLGWLRAVLHEILECALDLGAVALAPKLRTVVTRTAVTRIRVTLGQQRYEQVLAAPVAGPVKPADDLDSLLGEIGQCGAHELAGYAGQLHPALSESVRLSFERKWWDSPSCATLPHEVATSCLQRRVPHD